MGASEAELKEAVESAAYTRYFSTILNGAKTDYKSFTAEVDRMVSHIKGQTADMR